MTGAPVSAAEALKLANRSARPNELPRKDEGDTDDEGEDADLYRVEEQNAPCQYADNSKEVTGVAKELALFGAHCAQCEPVAERQSMLSVSPARDAVTGARLVGRA